MFNKEKINISSRFSNPAISNLEVHVRDVPFSLCRELVAAKSAKVAALLEKNSKDDISVFFRNIPAMPETFELLVKFCYGYEVHICTENVVPLACLACLLEMTETHCKNNLLAKASNFLEQKVLPSWNETIKALRTIEDLYQAKEIGLLDPLLESIVEKAQLDPRLLGEPMKTSKFDDRFEANPRRKLVFLDCEPEGLTTLSVQLYEPIIHVMNRRGISPEYLTASICKYVEKWVLSCFTAGEKISNYKRNSLREVIEAVERLLPNKKGLVPCSLLFDLLRFAIILGASLDCANGFETRIGKQLDQATVNDLFIPCQGNIEEGRYNIQCLRRILQSFYRNYTSSDPSGLLRVAELVEEFLGEVASDINLGTAAFISLEELAVATSREIQRSSDGIYRALDIYLDKHKNLTETEKEEICQLLDCQKMSPEALQHAAQNGKLPLRVVVQVLFLGQLHLRDRIATDIQEKMDQKLREEEEVGAEMEMVNMKVTELERENLIMKKEIEKCHRHSHSVARKEKIGIWKQMKRKFGCISTLHESNYGVNKKRVHP